MNEQVEVSVPCPPDERLEFIIETLDKRDAERHQSCFPKEPVVKDEESSH